jgi:hypothetical protein
MFVSTETASDHLSPLVAGQLRLAENVPLALARAPRQFAWDQVAVELHQPRLGQSGGSCHEIK